MAATKADREEIRNNLATTLMEQINCDVKITKEKLVEQLRWLAQDLTRAADDVEKEDGKPVLLNSLGEVQGRGGSIDRLCGLYAYQHQLRQTAAWAVQQATK